MEQEKVFVGYVSEPETLYGKIPHIALTRAQLRLLEGNMKNGRVIIAVKRSQTGRLYAQLVDFVPKSIRSVKQDEQQPQNPFE